MAKRIIRFMFLSCLKATEIIEKGLHFKLSYKERLRLKVHKIMCDACKNYETHSLFIENAIAEQENKRDKDTFTDIKKFKASILNKLPID